MYADDSEKERRARPEWLQALVQDLDRAETDLAADATLERRLRSMRREVLLPSPPRPVWQRRYVAVAAAMIMALSVVIINPLKEKNIPIPDPSLTTVTEDETLLLLTAAEELKFYQELEFLLWMDRANVPLG